MALPCRCAHGHAYTRTDAEDNAFVCPKDQLPIACDAESVSANDEGEKEAVAEAVRVKPAARSTRRKRR